MGDELGRAAGGADRRRSWGTFTIAGMQLRRGVGP